MSHGGQEQRPSDQWYNVTVADAPADPLAGNCTPSHVLLSREGEFRFRCCRGYNEARANRPDVVRWSSLPNAQRVVGRKVFQYSPPDRLSGVPVLTLDSRRETG